MENKRLWAVMFVLLAFTLAGCTSTESMGSFWLGDDGEISHDENPYQCLVVRGWSIHLILETANISSM